MIQTITHLEQTREILRELSFPYHLRGYRRLCFAIPRFREDPNQSMTKELYPYVARLTDGQSAAEVEASIRRVILFTWVHGNREVWEKYFPGRQNPPSNMTFIATIAEHLQ